MKGTIKIDRPDDASLEIPAGTKVTNGTDIFETTEDFKARRVRMWQKLLRWLGVKPRIKIAAIREDRISRQLNYPCDGTEFKKGN